MQFQYFLLALAGLVVFGVNVVFGDDFIVYSPYVTKGQSEAELRVSSQLDNQININGTHAIQSSISHAWTSWWRPELYIASFERPARGNLKQTGYELENIFQLSPEGKYIADGGFLLSYAYKSQEGVPNTIEFGPLLERHDKHFDEKVNLIWEKETGRNASNKYAFRTAVSLTYHVKKQISPSIEMYFRPNDHSYQIGPVIVGEILNNKQGAEIEYRIGTIFGINKAAPNMTILGSIAYEFF